MLKVESNFSKGTKETDSRGVGRKKNTEEICSKYNLYLCENVFIQPSNSCDEYVLMGFSYS